MSIDRIARILAATGDEYRYFSAIAPTLEDLTQLETDLGRTLPVDYSAFILRWGVLILDVDEATWRRPTAYEVRPQWQMQYARFVHGMGGSASRDFRVLEARKAFVRIDPRFLPILRSPMSREVEGYDAEDRWVRWTGSGFVATPHATFVDAVVASFEELIADRERLRVEPIAPA
ncbi:MAG: SMI1/KNR4 family protein [Polyangiaceae bacterium]|nr:SMI1/KNR4 family protein [Polyangiaceae bacterium]